MSGSVLVPVFVDGGRAAKGSLAALSESALRAAELGGFVDAVVVGSGVSQQLLSGLGRYGARTVFSCDRDPALSGTWVAALTACLCSGEYRYVVMAGGPLALAVAGAVAARCHGGVVTDVTALRVAGRELVAEKPVFRDTQVAAARVVRGAGVLVARAGAFTSSARGELPDAAVERIDVADMDMRVRVVERAGVDDPGRKLAAADVIVTGGRGLGAADGFTAIERLAEALEPLVGESAVGATRAVVDAGWRPQDAQIGLTGRTVSPKLYVAVGVSGAPQHRSGMETSERILAINNDQRAPIFKFSDLGVVADLHTLLPALTRALTELRSQRHMRGPQLSDD